MVVPTVTGVVTQPTGKSKRFLSKNEGRSQMTNSENCLTNLLAARYELSRTEVSLNKLCSDLAAVLAYTHPTELKSETISCLSTVAEMMGLMNSLDSKLESLKTNVNQTYLNTSTVEE